MDQIARNDITHSPIRHRSWLVAGAVTVSVAIALSTSPIAMADSHSDAESGAVTGAGSGPTLGVGGPSSYTGGATANHPEGSASQGVGDVSSYTGQGTAGAPNNGTNSTTRTGNFGPGNPLAD